MIIGTQNVCMERAGESLRIFCRNEKEKTRLPAQKYIADHEVKVTEPYTKPKVNISLRGIIIDVDLDMEDDEIRAATSAVTATRIMRMIGGQQRKTGQVIVTFEGDVLPEFTYMGWRRFRIQTYIPDPIRCYKCQHYGHKVMACQQQEKCPICAGKHSARNCDRVGKEPDAKFLRSDTKCANCGGEHPASYRGCPKFKTAKEITKIQATAPTRISYAEAARKQRSTRQEKEKANQATTIEKETEKERHSENARTLPPSSEYNSITIPPKNNSETDMNQIDQTETTTNENTKGKPNKTQEDHNCHSNYVDKKTVHNFITTVMDVLTNCVDNYDKEVFRNFLDECQATTSTNQTSDERLKTLCNTISRLADTLRGSKSSLQNNIQIEQNDSPCQSK